ncbi:hypothetical protein BDZ85DRAFT_255624 [Elsinoe ampelina]|uniref:Uncharacterized protein n=1 Tax=Elsinoe ampelina TaxID=302913 RepID=A0A6A6GRL2_9PEZI|nr:hypothetical protein BDZ85DRAFT_255624 [Elsinoe ampelina]
MWSKDDKLDKMEEPPRPPYHHGYDMTQGPDLPWEASYATEEAEEWDDSIYDQARLEHLEKVHDRNKAVVGAYMGGGRTDAGTRKNAAIKAAKANEEIERPSVGPIPLAVRPDNKRPKNKKSGLADQREHFSGRLAFADQENWEKFQILPYNTIEEAIEAAMTDPFDKNLMSIEVTHDPGDSILSDLDLPRISIMDIARTRLQLFHIRVITKRAAECMIDFCPDLLLGFRLMQVVSETDFGNTGIQFRLGYNGSMLSDSTLTKRISSAVALEHNKTRAAEANKADKDFHKEHRKNYNKYKVWRAWKRDHSTSKPNTFSLAEAAKQYRESKTKEDAGAKLFASLKPKRKISGSTTSSSGSASSSKAGSRRSSFAKAEVDKSKTVSQVTAAIDRLRDLSKDDGGLDEMAVKEAEEDNKSVLGDKTSTAEHPRLDEGRSITTGNHTANNEEKNEATEMQEDEPMESVIKVAVSDEARTRTPATRKRARASSPGAGQSSLFSFFTSEPAPKRRSVRK